MAANTFDLKRGFESGRRSHRSCRQAVAPRPERAVSEEERGALLAMLDQRADEIRPAAVLVRIVVPARERHYAVRDVLVAGVEGGVPCRWASRASGVAARRRERGTP